MKNLKQTTEELIKILSPHNPLIIEDDKWDYYADLSGFYNGEYYGVTLSRYKNDKDKIEIAHTADNPLVIVSLIKEIEPEFKITYQKSTTTYTSITV